MNRSKHSRLKKALVVIACTIITGMPCTAAAQLFKNGEKICFVGNSITNHGGFHHDIALFYATRYPKQKIYIINSGVSGNRTVNVINRMDSDVLINHPDWAVIKLGMNDVNKDLYTAAASLRPDIQQQRQKTFDTYRTNYETIIKILKKNNCRIILQTPTIYDETCSIPGSEKLKGRNSALRQYGTYVKELAHRYGLPLVDYWTIMDSINKKIQQLDSTATIIGPDRVHPGAVGHFIMAYQFLKTTGVFGEVSSTEIQVSKSGVKASARNAIVTGLKRDKDGLSFNLLENALPFPVPKGAGPALTLVPFTKELNKELIVVKGLLGNSHDLVIDNKLVGTYSAAEFKEGVDISLNEYTPQYRQAQKVLHSFESYWKLESEFRYMRGMEMGRLQAKKVYNLEDARVYFAHAMAAAKDTASSIYKDLLSFRDTYLPIKESEPLLLQQMKLLQDEIYQENQPVVHHFKILKH